MGQAFGCIQVDESTVVVKEAYGKLGVLETGCHCLPWCLGHRVAGKVSLRVQQLDVRCEAKTKDNAFVNVVASIQYCVIKDKVSDAFKNFSDAKGQIQVKGLIQANVSNAIREGISKRNWDSAFEEKNDIAKYVKEELEKSMSAYGFKIVQIHIEPDITVKKAMNEIIAETIKKAAENKGKAEAEKISQIKRAEAKAEAEKILAKGEGEGEGEGEVGLGIVRQDQTAVDGLRDGVLASSENVPRTSAKDNMGGLVQ